MAQQTTLNTRFNKQRLSDAAKASAFYAQNPEREKLYDVCLKGETRVVARCTIREFATRFGGSRGYNLFPVE